MIFGTRWCAAALVPLAYTALATTALAQETAGPRDGGPAEARVVRPACTGADQAPTSKTLEGARAATLCLLNAERAERGLQPLRSAPPITQASQAYSERMVRERFFAHAVLDGYLRDGTYWISAQNLAWGDGPMAAPGTIVEAWMASPGHRRNILDPAVTEIGVGIAIGSPEPRSRLNAATYTTDFGVVTDARGAPSPSTAPAPSAVPAPSTKVRWITKRGACPTPKRSRKRAKSVERRRRTRCVQVMLLMQRLA